MQIIGKAVKKPTTNRSSREHAGQAGYTVHSTSTQYGSSTLPALLWALVLLFGQLNANAVNWNLDNISYEIKGSDPDHETGPTVFGMNPESPDGKYLAFPQYYDGYSPGDGNAASEAKPAWLKIRNRETGETWTADTVELNNHNGANHMWLGNSMIAYHKRRMWTFSIYDLNTRQVIVDNIYGQLAHKASSDDVIYYTISNGYEPPSGLSDRPYGDEGLWKYDVNAGTETQLVTVRDVEDYLDKSGLGGRSLNHADPSPSGKTVSFGIASDYKVLVDVDGGRATNLRVMEQKPFHALWFDEHSMMTASRRSQNIKVIKRINLRGWGFEVLGGDGAHEGGSPDLEWFAGESGPAGKYEEEDDGNTRVYLYARGTRKPIATLGRWGNGFLTWDRNAHANPAFSGDGNRLYYLRSYSDGYFLLNYVNLESYKKTIRRYCGAGEPPYRHEASGDDRYIKSISITKTDTNGDNEKVLVPELTYDKFPDHGYQYLYHTPYHGAGVSGGDRVTVRIRASGDSKWSRIWAYVDWNQSFHHAGSELVFSQGRADQENPDNLSFTKTFTVPNNALAGDTLMRIRFYNASWSWPGLCGSDYKTTTYDIPIKVAYSGDNACVEADQIEASGDSSNADNAFDGDSSTYWSVDRTGHWLKKCFTTPTKLRGIEFGSESLYKRYLFDIELLDSDNHFWFKAFEYQRSMGDNDDSEKYYFPKEASEVNAAAVRLVGYGSDHKYDFQWTNVSKFGMSRGSSKSAVLTGDAYVTRGYCDNHGADKDNRLVVQNGKVRNDSFLKFRLDELPDSVDEATFWLKVRNVPGGASYNSLHVVGNGWTQSTITGVDLPSVGDFINTVPTPGKDQWLKVDITSQVNAARADDTDLSLRLSSPHKREGGIWYYSREASDPRNRPRLTYIVGVN